MARFPQVYRAAEWERARAYVIARAQGLCEECIRHDRIESGHDVHHIIPLDDDNWREWDIAYNPMNLEYLCKSCHDERHGKGAGLHLFTKPVEVDRQADRIESRLGIGEGKQR